jgi:hypothetical protein
MGHSPIKNKKSEFDRNLAEHTDAKFNLRCQGSADCQRGLFKLGHGRLGTAHEKKLEHLQYTKLHRLKKCEVVTLGNREEDGECKHFSLGYFW